jgi:8-oxo-dGTP diphosphatase
LKKGKFRIIVVAIIENKAGKILLIKRAKAKSPGQNLWALPGGGVEFGEKSIDAAIREIKEEIGLDFKPKYSFHFDDFYSVSGYHSLVICFFGECEGAIKPCQEEVSDIHFFSAEEISLSGEIAFCHQDLIKQYFDILKANPNWAIKAFDSLTINQ